jgi:hypothetical protein
VSIESLRVSNQGWDIYKVQHENDVHQYRIAMGDDGRVIPSILSGLSADYSITLSWHAIAEGALLALPFALHRRRPKQRFGSCIARVTV